MTFRVALVAVSSAAAGGLLAALVAIWAVDQLIADQADRRLRAATVTLSGELDEDGPKKRKAKLIGTLADENDEIVTSGIRLAVFEGERLLAGDAWIQAQVPGSCVTFRASGDRVRACSRAYGHWLLVAAQPSDDGRLAWFYLVAAVGAVLLGAGVGAASSAGLMPWALGSLQTLSTALRGSRPEKPGALDLGPPSECEEVEAIRSALLDLTRRVQTLLDQAERFAADAAHELRTPLTILRTEIELMLEQAPHGEPSALERIGTRLTRLSELVERLLLLSLPTENLRAGFETVAISEVVEEVVAELPADERARVVLQLETEGLVRADAELLRSLISNALENSRKFAPSGSLYVELAARSTNEFSEVTLQIRDMGPGIPAEFRARVLEPFFRARPRSARGHGLGLALIGHIARAHGGTAEFLDVAEGACLSVVLPAWRPASTDGSGGRTQQT
jgi:signal transduction histidine kinase